MLISNAKARYWDGVNNPVAVKNLRSMKRGDKLVIYHTGDEKRAIGTATVLSVDASDSKNPRVEIKAGKRLARPFTLAELRGEPRFADSPLLHQSRLSVVPLTDEQYELLLGK